MEAIDVAEMGRFGVPSGGMAAAPPTTSRGKVAVPRVGSQASSCTMIRLRWISSKSNWIAATALAAATSGASTVPSISPLARNRTTRQRRFIRPASFAGLSFLLERRGGVRN